jgi:SNF2 family DNA or RNA helicase
MGLGKSAQTILASDRLNINRVLVITPAVGRINWEREFQRWQFFPREFQIIERMDQMPDPDRSVICGYEYAMRHFARLTSQKFDVCIIDEAHFLKSTDAKRTQNILGKNGVVRAAKRVWLLTGTPTPNGCPSELWVVLYTFGRTKLKYLDFIRYFCKLDTRYNPPTARGPRDDRVSEFKELLKPIMLRRLKEDVMKDLPPITYSHFVVEPTPVDLDTNPFLVQWVFPKDRSKEFEQKMDAQRALVAETARIAALGNDGLRALAALSSSVSTLRMVTGIQKYPAVADIIEEELKSNAYEKIVIFAIHQTVIEGMRQRLRKFKPVTLYGLTPVEKRQRNIDKFMKEKSCRVFIGNIQACGTNITLTAAHHVAFVEQSWVPDDNAQAAMRVHRIGQTNPVFVRFFGLANSFDDRLSEILKRKTRDKTKILEPSPLTKSHHLGST